MNIGTFTYGLIICFLLSFMIGIERQIRRRNIGLRTMILVAIGSYIFVSFSFLVTGYEEDISRIASQVVAGIGFLGAGVIIKDNEKSRIKGLTTAATLWCDAGIGILCAGGFIYEAIISSVVVLFSNVILRYFNSIVNKKFEDNLITDIFNITLITHDSDEVVKYIIEYCNKNILYDNLKVNDEEVKFDIKVKKNYEKRVDNFIYGLVSKFNISEYEIKKINEIHDNDENEEF